MTADHPAATAADPGRYALFGHPVVHSPSPWLHNRFADATGIEHRYKPIDVPDLDLARALEAFDGQGGNITLPLKEQAHEICIELGGAARRCGAVNTIKRIEGGWFGDNTDGHGLVADLEQNLEFGLTGASVLLIGAGGAARGALFALLGRDPRQVVICNRTPVKAQALAAEAGVDWVALDALHQLAPPQLVVNASSAGHYGQQLPLPAGLMGPGCLCYDMSYGPASAQFLGPARAAGARIADGIGMLVEQAAEAFEIWHGVRPQSGPEVVATLARHLAG